MARAHRHFVAGQVWHITQRCHNKDFLLRYAIDRRRWMYWLFQARRRYNLSILNYIVTANHIHLLVQDCGDNSIPSAIQLVAGRTAQEFNKRQGRRGSFWEDRYHATAVQSDAHLLRCMAYIDLNMVRARRVEHPIDWRESGYFEALHPKKRGSRIDPKKLCAVLGFETPAQLQLARDGWIAALIDANELQRQAYWTESVAVGNREYTVFMKRALGSSSPGRQPRSEGDCYSLREDSAIYQNSSSLLVDLPDISDAGPDIWSSPVSALVPAKESSFQSFL